MRSSSSSLSKRRMKSIEKEREKRKNTKGWKSFSKELLVRIGKGAVFSTKVCYRNMHEHLFLSGFVLFGFLLYAFLPSFFWFLVSSSPVIICTTLLLGTLLSFGEPHIPEVEEEEMKTCHDTSPLQDHSVNDDGNVEKRERDLLSTSSSESESEIEDEVVASSLEVGEHSKMVDSQDDEPYSPRSSLRVDGGLESREREFGGARDIVSSILARLHLPRAHEQTKSTSISTSSLIDGSLKEETAIHHRSREKFDENMYAHGDMVAGDTLQISANGSRVMENAPDIDAIGEVELEGFKPEPYYTLLKLSHDQDDHSEFGSDKSESCSPDASISDISPMLDELCPFIPSNNVEDSDLGTFIDSIHENMGDSDSESERLTQPHSSISGSDELAENMEAHEDKDGEPVAWTADDEKNVMDLGSSEVERNRRLENLMVKWREWKNMNPEEHGLLLGLRSGDPSPVMDRLSQLRVQVSSISTKRENPFDDDSEGVGGLPPIPGSAPSVFLRKSNPFEFPEKKSSKSDKTIHAGQSELDFEDFATGSASASSIKEKHNATSVPYFVAVEKTQHKYQRQLSDLSFPKAESRFESERLYPVLDQKYGRDPLVHGQREENDSHSSFVKGEDARIRETDETGEHASDVFDIARSDLEVESTDIQYESFTSLEMKVGKDGTTLDRVFDFDSDEKMGSPRLHSDETIVSDSSTDSEKNSESEHSNDEMLQASQPSVDEPAVLTSEVSILPAIADKIKISFGQEDQHDSSQLDVSAHKFPEQEGDSVEYSDIIMDRAKYIDLVDDMKEVDERILTELDAVGDFSVVKLQAYHDQVQKDVNSYDMAENHAIGNLHMEESGVSEAEHKAKSIEDMESAMKKLVEVEISSGQKANDSDMREIEARCYDDIDLSLMHHSGVSLDDLLVTNEHSEEPAHLSDMQEINVRSLNDMDLALMSHGAILDDVLVEDAHPEPSTHQSDLYEIEAGSLDDLCQVLGQKDMLTEPVVVSSNQHEDNESDLHEIKAQSLAELQETMEKEEIPNESFAVSLEQHEVENVSVGDMGSSSEHQNKPADSKRDVPKRQKIRVTSFKDLHTAIFTLSVASEPAELPCDLVGIAALSSGDELLDSEEDGRQLGSATIVVETHEFKNEVRSMEEINQATKHEDPQSENKTEADSVDVHFSMPEAEVQLAEDMNVITEQEQFHGKSLVNEPHFDEVDSKIGQSHEQNKVVTQSEAEAPAVEGFHSMPQLVEEAPSNGQSDSVDAHSSMPEAEAQPVDNSNAISGQEHSHVESLTIQSHLHELEAKSLEDLNGILCGKNTVGTHSEANPLTIEDLHLKFELVQETSSNG